MQVHWCVMTLKQGQGHTAGGRAGEATRRGADHACLASFPQNQSLGRFNRLVPRASKPNPTHCRHSEPCCQLQDQRRAFWDTLLVLPRRVWVSHTAVSCRPGPTWRHREGRQQKACRAFRAASPLQCVCPEDRSALCLVSLVSWQCASLASRGWFITW